MTTRLLLFNIIFVGSFGIMGCSEVEFSPESEFSRQVSLATGSISINGGALYTQSTLVDLQLSAKSADEMYVTNDSSCLQGGSWEPFESEKKWLLPVENTQSSVYVKFRNRYEKQSECLFAAITHDNIKPKLKWLVTPKKLNNYRSDRLKIQIEEFGSGVKKVDCQTLAGQVSRCQESEILVKTAEGQQSIVVYAIDRAGNLADPIVYEWEVDLTPPKLSWIKFPPQFSSLKIHELQVAAQDANDIHKILWSSQEDEYAQGDEVFRASVTLEGMQKVSVKAIDAAGNESLPTQALWVADWTAPSLQVTKQPPAVNSETNSEIHFSLSDNLSVAQAYCQVGDEEFKVCHSPYWTKNPHQGESILRLKAIDQAGNESPVKLLSWQVDLSGPKIEMTHNLDGMDNLATGHLNYSITDSPAGVKSWSCILDGQKQSCPLVSGSLSFSKLSLGWHHIKIEASDLVGNVSQKEVSFRIVQATKKYNTPLKIDNYGEVDILFVIDNSRSMSEEQEEMARRFNSFLSILYDLSWQVAITTTEVESNEKYSDGRLIQFGKGGPYQLDASLNFDLSTKLFSQTIQRDEVGSSIERGIYAAYRALERRANQNEHKEFFRKNSHLQVVLVSDEDESGDKKRDQPNELIKYVESSFGLEKNFRFHSIIVRPGDNDCSDRWDHTVGQTYHLLSQLTGGIVGNLCAKDYTQQLTEIGEDIRKQVRRFTLACEPYDSNGDGDPNLEVNFAPGTKPVNYHIEGSSLVFDEAPPLGHHKINYECIAQ